MLVGPEKPTRAAQRLVGETVNAGSSLIARKDRLVEDVRLLGVVLSTAFEGRIDRVNERVEDYRRLIEKRRGQRGGDDSKRGSETQSLPFGLASAFRTGAQAFRVARGERSARAAGARKEKMTMSSPTIDPQPPLQAAPPLPLPPAAPYLRLPKSPGLAAFLALFPGLGHVYAGTIARAFAFFFAFVGSIYLTAEGHVFPFAFVIPFVYLYNIIDAWKLAARHQPALPGRPRASPRRRRASSRRCGARCSRSSAC